MLRILACALVAGALVGCGTPGLSPDTIVQSQLEEVPLQSAVVEAKDITIVLYDTTDRIGYIAVSKAQGGWRVKANGPAGGGPKGHDNPFFYWVGGGGPGEVLIIYGVTYDQRITRLELTWRDGSSESIVPTGHLFAWIGKQTTFPERVRAFAGAVPL